jgi:hypothetical protein
LPYFIGNPPFLGGKKLRIKLGNEYVEKIYQAFPEVKGQPDFCVFWFRKASDLLGNKGRGGLVGTNYAEIRMYYVILID